jgi:hypothetical protein
MKQNLLFWYSNLLIVGGSFLWMQSTFIPSTIQNTAYLFSMNTIEMLEFHEKFGMFTFGLFGALMVGWGITLLYFSQNYDYKALNYLYSALLAWFVLDFTTSILSRFYLNAIFSVLLLVLAFICIYTFDKAEKIKNKNSNII